MPSRRSGAVLFAVIGRFAKSDRRTTRLLVANLRIMFGTLEDWVEAASSFHPGGANFAFANRSVSFLKSTINSCPIPPGGQVFPPGVTPSGSAGVFSVSPAQIRLGVGQALSTRSSGEVISDTDLFQGVQRDFPMFFRSFGCRRDACNVHRSRP